jgi:exosortase A
VTAVAVTDRSRRTVLAVLFAALTLVGWAYFDTFSSMVVKWQTDAAFSHGILILPISLWLAWRQRAALAAVPLQPAIAGVLAVALCVLAWIVARGSGVLVIEQFAVVAMLAAVVLAALGWPATRLLLVPLGFLLFMVPFGRGLVPALMQVTADFATALLQWSGIPVLRSHMFISIPGGSFEVARACSGLNYFITSIVLGCLYAYLNYRGAWKRLACVAAFVVIPIVLNALRVYITILVSHLTDMRFGPGTEHVTFGRIFFVVMMLGLFWIGRRWHDDEPPSPATAPRARAVTSTAWTTWWPLPVACVVALAGPPFVSTSIARAQAQAVNNENLVSMPKAINGWRGPLQSADRGWRPLYTGGVLERQVSFKDAQSTPVDVFVAVYGLGTSIGAEMISYSNVIDPDERGSLANDSRLEIELRDGSTLTVRELVVADDASRRLVWHWYVVGTRPVVSPFSAKALEAVAFVTGGTYFERIVAVSTPLDDTAHDRLRSFVGSFNRCIAAGFAAEACGG